MGIFFKSSLLAQTISPRFFSQNAWMPDTIGNAAACTQPPCILYGKLHQKWSLIANSGSAMVRFGGIAPDRNLPTNFQYIKMIDSIRAKGMEPIIQVPFHNWRYSAAQAAQLVQYINVTKGRNIKYWIIGNEPDNEYGYTSSAQVAAYIKPFASAMKAADPSILLIGPETAWYNTSIINGLTSPGGPDDITGKDANGRYYIDLISFHYYGFNGTQTRPELITKVTASGGLNSNLSLLNTRLANCNAFHNRTGTAALKSAITEANVNWQNPSTDNLNGLGTNSFIGGQFIAEIFGVGLKNNVDFINMWSVVEGNSTALNIGYVDPTTGNKKPAYYHFQLLAQNFKGNLIPAVSTQSNVKVFAAQNSQSTTVLIMNEDLSTNHNFTLRLNMSAASGSNSLKVNVDANTAQEYNDYISNQSTILLVFNGQGTLIKKITYGLASHAVSNLAPTTSTYAAAAATITPATTITPVTSSSVTNVTTLANLQKCSGQSATLTASGTGTIYWFASTASSVAISTGSVFVTPILSTGTNTSTATYYAANTLTNSAARTAITITVMPLPLINVNSGTICTGQSFTLAPSGASTYSYSGGSAIVTPSATSVYSVSGTSAFGCPSAAQTQATVVVAPLQLSVNSGSVCRGNSFVFTPTGAANYTYSSGSATVYPKRTSTYTITGSNGQGCSTSVTSTVVVLKPSECSSARYAEEIAMASIAPDSALIQQDISNADVAPTFTVLTESGKTVGLKSTQQKELRLVKIYPNPNRGDFIVDAPVSMQLELFNSLGTTIRKYNLEEGLTNINLSDQAPGVYIARLVYDGELIVIRIIRQ